MPKFGLHPYIGKIAFDTENDITVSKEWKFISHFFDN
jgi:hypothetical protein